VIAIIVLLMALTVGVMSKVYQSMDETKTVTEVSKLAEALNQFKGQFGRYPPSKIMLCENGIEYFLILNDPSVSASVKAVAAYSMEYLTSLFPGIQFRDSMGNTVLHDWNGDNQFVGDTTVPGANGHQMLLLEGEECLVYFLGGMRYRSLSMPFVYSAPQGFNTDKSNPTTTSPGARIGPFYAFDEGRVQNSPIPRTRGRQIIDGLFVYNDVYGTPYAYFLARYQGHNNYPNLLVPAAASTPNDCHILTTNTASNTYFVPYFIGTVPPGGNWAVATSFQFHKGDTFQIISAGRDKLFGTGGQYDVKDPENSPFFPGSPADMLKANFDNITNFTSGRVVPQ
jgi:hypothetical protein